MFTQDIIDLDNTEINMLMKKYNNLGMVTFITLVEKIKLVVKYQFNFRSINNNFILNQESDMNDNVYDYILYIIYFMIKLPVEILLLVIIIFFGPINVLMNYIDTTFCFDLYWNRQLYEFITFNSTVYKILTSNTIRDDVYWIGF